MKHTEKQIRSFKREVQAWIKENGLGGTEKWWTAEKYLEDELEEYGEYCYLVMSDENDVYNAIHGLSNDHPDHQAYRRYRPELDAILEKHKLWMEFKDSVTFLFMGDPKTP